MNPALRKKLTGVLVGIGIFVWLFPPAGEVQSAGKGGHRKNTVASGDVAVKTASVEEDTVALIFCNGGRFLLKTGTTTLFYDRDSTNGYLWIFPSETAKVGLATKIVHGKRFDLLDTAKVRSFQPFHDQNELGVEIVSQTDLAEYRSRVTVFPNFPGLIRFQSEGRANRSFSVPDNPKDFYFYHFSQKRVLSLSPYIDAEQPPFAAGVTYFSEPSVLGATIFYFQNYSALTSYFENMKAEPRQAVFARSSGFGYTRPFTLSGQIPANQPVVLTDAFLRVLPGGASGEEERAFRYIESLFQVLNVMGGPPVPSVDWGAIADRTLSDLQDPACWVTVDGHEYLRSYVDLNRPGTAELITQLDVLVGLKRYEQKVAPSPLLERLYRKLIPLLEKFYHSDYRTMVNDVPPQGVTRGDSWYAVQLHLGLSTLASLGDTTARRLLLASAPALMELAHNVNYHFPVFFDYRTNLPVSGEEPDVAGGYAYLMLDLFELTGDSLYLEEAEKAIAKIRGKGFHLTYEVHMTAAAAAACARLFRLTGKEFYLRWSTVPVANILRLCWIWECDYGYASEYRTFFGLSPMPMTGYVAAKELYETWYYLNVYLEQAGSSLPFALRSVVELFLQYAPLVAYGAMPPFLPAEAFYAGRCLYDSYNRADLMIPLEDLRTGFHLSGQVGQQIYGAGAPFTFFSLGAGMGSYPGGPNVPEKGWLQVYPNPARRNGRTGNLVFRVQVPAGRLRKGSLHVFNMLGQRVWQRNVEIDRKGRATAVWNLKEGQLSAGIYFVRFRWERGMLVNKFIFLR